MYCFCFINKFAKTYRYVLILFLFLMINSCAQTERTVLIRLSAASLSDTSTVYISGNNDLLGQWTANSVRLERVAPGIYERRFEFLEGEKIEFKFTLGSWSREALLPDGSIPQNYSFQVSGDTVLSYTVTKWGTGARVIRGQITGSVQYHRGLSYDGLDSRDIVVWLPPDYEKNTSERYPVLYMHDGQNIIDPATSSQGIDWSADETADSLIRTSAVTPFIIVGINNTRHRFEEYSKTPLGEKYMDFVIKTVKPLIDKTYRTLPGRNSTATIGSSMGGLISFMLVWEHPDVFSMAGCFSPALTIPETDMTGSEKDYVPYVSRYKGKNKDLKIYIDNGTQGVDQLLQKGVENMTHALKSKGYKEGKNLIVYYDKGADHNEAAWAKRLWRPLEFFFGK